MPCTDRDTAELAEVVVSVVAGLVVAHQRVDHAAIAAEVGKLLHAVAVYSNTLAERPDDAALVKAISRLP